MLIKLELTEDETKLMVGFLKTTPIQGNLETLPKVLTMVSSILRKIQDATNPAPEQPKAPRKRRH